jgi:hypothetical protein
MHPIKALSTDFDTQDPRLRRRLVISSPDYLEPLKPAEVSPGSGFQPGNTSDVIENTKARDGCKALSFERAVR